MTRAAGAALPEGLVPGSKELFRRFLTSDPARLHVAAHSHHPWPDVTLAAQQRAWLDAAELHDDKWERVFGEVLPEAAAHVAGRLNLPQAGTVAFAPNTHDLVRRVLSCLPQPARVLTTGSEFHSFARQAARLEEAGRLRLTRVPAEPFATFVERFAAAARAGHDLVFLSHVLFDSGFVVGDLAALVAAVPDERTFVVVDGYHGFMALPTDLSELAGRVFYLAGGYKYAMAGEGACFLHAPPGYGERPVDTGWFASFGTLTDANLPGPVPYAPGGARFLGATFDPTGLYRFNAVQRLLAEQGIDVARIHAHVRLLQRRFLAALGGLELDWLPARALLPDASFEERGHFLTFRVADPVRACARLRAQRVVADVRGDCLRLGFGLYHDLDDIDDLCARLVAAGV